MLPPSALEHWSARRRALISVEGAELAAIFRSVASARQGALSQRAELTLLPYHSRGASGAAVLPREGSGLSLRTKNVGSCRTRTIPTSVVIAQAAKKTTRDVVS